jgi:hypothetical protein
MAFKNNTLKGRVDDKHKRAGSPQWDSRKTIEVCIKTARELEAEGFDRAIKFRNAIKRNDEKYIKTWVLGCHFKWLNPR